MLKDMKKNSLQVSLGLALIGGLLAGCGPSGGSGSSSSGSTNATAAAPSAPPSAEAVAKYDKALSDLTEKLVSAAKSKSDDVLGGVGKDLGTSVQKLASSLAGQQEVKATLDKALTALTDGKQVEAFDACQKVVAAKLTPEQMKLAQETGNLVSAYIVQKDFSKLEGSEGDVAKLVTSLRQGSLTGAVAPLQGIMQNAKLTQPQKDILSALSDKYAPGLKKLGDSAQDLKKIGGGLLGK